jgi:hypothetical protein
MEKREDRVAEIVDLVGNIGGRPDLEEMKAQMRTRFGELLDEERRMTKAWRRVWQTERGIRAKAFRDLVGMLLELRKFAREHHGDQKEHHWLHALKIDIPERIEKKLDEYGIDWREELEAAETGKE